MKQKIILIFILFFHLTVTSQVIVNGYAKITSITGNTLTLSIVSEIYDSFEDGEKIIIMQMQDSVIGGNTSNNSAFGNVASIASAGLYETLEITSHTESGGIPTSITVNGSLSNTYNLNVNSVVQIITYPTFGSSNYTTSNDMTCLAWNGDIGGVLAFNVNGTLTIANDISVKGKGFRGGATSINYNNGTYTCGSAGEFILTSFHTRSGGKGEGIYKSNDVDYDHGRAKIANGGGGGGGSVPGNTVNAGGAGGSNYSYGGYGGFGYTCLTYPGGGGIGGAGLDSYITAFRIFMGGAGGGSQQNDSQGSAGGNGGGIILIKADIIRTNSGCGTITINADGDSVISGGPYDGDGGGGAGGSIVIENNSWDVSGSCQIDISASGGDGGASLWPFSTSAVAGGGGGGQGLIVLFTPQPPNMTFSTNYGEGGLSNTGGLTAGDGGGPNNAGVLFSYGLPIELLSFSAILLDNGIVDLNWQTSSEINNDYFTVERSTDARFWEGIEKVDGAGNSSVLLTYQTYDSNPYDGVSYYRLRQTDFDNQFKYSKIKSINKGLEKEMLIYPSPTKDWVIIEGENIDFAKIRIKNTLGQDVTSRVRKIKINESKLMIDLSTLSNGIYYIKTSTVTNKIAKQ